MRKFKILFAVLPVLIILSACSTGSTDTAEDSLTKEVTNTYRTISQEEAKSIMDEGNDIIILDVRTMEEYNEGHIKGAICIPNETIKEAPEKLPDLNQNILVYCRSGRRSKEAAAKLSSLGYTNVLEFGGIIDWEYEITDN